MTREETMTTTDDKQKEKIKTPFAKVIVDGRGAYSYFSILYFDRTDNDVDIGYSSYYLNYVFNWLNEEFEIVEDGNSTLTALRPVSREQVERVWKGEWVGDNDEKVGTIDGPPIKSSTCSVCGNWLVGSDEYDCSGHFCPACGRAMTDEAVQMVMERLEALKDGKDD